MLINTRRKSLAGSPFYVAQQGCRPQVHVRHRNLFEYQHAVRAQPWLQQCNRSAQTGLDMQQHGQFLLWRATLEQCSASPLV